VLYFWHEGNTTISAKPTMKTLSLKLPETLDSRLTAAARRRGQSRSAVVREALEALLGGDNAGREGSCLDLAADLAGCVAGPGDLSVNPDRLRGYGR
jgi:Arc/MetJ-type ribon-helix-helix transcriptional regulator